MLLRRGGTAPAGPHRCSPPGDIARLFQHITDGSAWRCDMCFRVFYWGRRWSERTSIWWRGWTLSPSHRFAGLATTRHPLATEYQRDDYGILLRAEIPGDEPWVAVEVENATPNKDGSRDKFWIRIPPTIWTAREGVAWSFNFKPDWYKPITQT